MQVLIACQWVDVSAECTHLFVVKGVGNAKVCETFKQVKGHAPFSGVWDARYVQSVFAADVTDNGLVVRESYDMSGCNNVVHADKCGAILVGDDR